MTTPYMLVDGNALYIVVKYFSVNLSKSLCKLVIMRLLEWSNLVTIFLISNLLPVNCNVKLLQFWCVYCANLGHEWKLSLFWV